MPDILRLGLPLYHDSKSPEPHSEAELTNKIAALKELNEKGQAEAEELKTQVLQKALMAILQEKQPEQTFQTHKQHAQGSAVVPPSRIGGRCSVIATHGLSLERRHQLVASAIEAAKAEIAKVKAEIAGAKRLLKETIKNGELQAAEVRRDAFEFRRDVIVGAEDVATGLTGGDALLKWLQGRIRKREKQLEKLRGKIRNAKQKSLKTRAGNKWPGSGANELQYIDLHQLEIENEQFAQKVEEAKADIAAKKRRCSCILQAQAVLKDQLTRSMEEGANLAAGLSNRRAALERTKSEAERVAKETESVKNEIKRLLVQSRGGTQLPQVIDLVRQKATLLEKTRLLKSWRRKVEVAELEARTVRADLKVQANQRKQDANSHQ